MYLKHRIADGQTVTSAALTRGLREKFISIRRLPLIVNVNFSRLYSCHSHCHWPAYFPHRDRTALAYCATDY